MGQENVLRSLLHIFPNFYYFFWPLFLLGFVYGLVRCVKEAVSGAERAQFIKWLVFTWVCLIFIESPTTILWMNNLS